MPGCNTKQESEKDLCLSHLHFYILYQSLLRYVFKLLTPCTELGRRWCMEPGCLDRFDRWIYSQDLGLAVT